MKEKIVVVHKKDYEVKAEKQSLTRYKMNAQGRFIGRFANVPEYASDKIRYVRIKNNLNYNGFLRKGQIIGRLKKNASLPKKMIIRVKAKRMHHDN